MNRLWPRSLMGQVMLAVAIALLLVQGLGAFLVYRAQSERREAALIHGAAFRLVMEMRGSDYLSHFLPHHPVAPGGQHFRLDRSSVSPLRAGDVRYPDLERGLARVLAEQGFNTDGVVFAERKGADDPQALDQIARRSARFGRPPPLPGDKILLIAVHFAGENSWLVTRVRSPPGKAELIGPLLWQTIVIYVVLIVAIALILIRITRPLAALTGRLENFARTRDAADPIEPQGPDDLRRLIEAHNAMEARISALLDEKDIMLGAIGHDLKTPLAALRVRIESVEDEAERLKMAGTIEDIVTTLDDILSLARVGRPSDAQERTELSALVASVVEEYEDLGEPVTLGDTERLVLQLRPTWLRRAVRNLIDNAVRYGGAARVSMSRCNGQAIIRIEDNGPGIPDASIGAMMDPFARGEPSRNTGTGGAGLGLALARAIADQHGGTLTLANRKVSDGTVVGLAATLALPIA